MNASGIASASSYRQRASLPRAIALTLGGVLALGFSVMGGSFAHADDFEIQSVEYVSNEAGDVSTVDAGVLTDAAADTDIYDDGSSAGWFACLGPLTTSEKLAFHGDINVILSDECVWDANSIDIRTTSFDHAGSLTFWGGTENTGKLRANSTDGVSSIRTSYDSLYQVSSSITVNGGSIVSVSPASAAGIGGGYTNVSGPITVQWRASVQAIGGAPGAAGIGSGASFNINVVDADPIAVHTTGLVRAVAGGVDGSYKAGADIGTGGPRGGTNTAISYVPTVTVPAAIVSGSGTVQMYDEQHSLVPVAEVDHAAVGSALTYLVTPADGYRLIANPGTTKVGTNLYRHSITPATPSIPIGFTFEEIPAATLSLTASPAAGQTRPGNVVLSATASDSVGPISGQAVVFTINGAEVPAVDTNSSGIATYTVTAPPAGSYDFGASFVDESGDTITATPISGYSVARATQEVTLHGVPAAAVYGDAPVTLSLTKQGTGEVSYSTDGSPAVTLSGSTLSFAKAGTAAITGAIAQDDTYASATATATVTVTEATPAVALTYTGGATTATPVALTAKVSVPAGASEAVSGATVQFYDGSTAIGAPAAVSSTGEASYQVTAPTRGAHSYTAKYAGITDYYAEASSNTVSLDIAGKPQPDLAIQQPSSTSTVYGAAPFSLSLTGQLSTTTPTWSVPLNDAFTISPDGNITVTGAGSATVSVTVPGDDSYEERTVTLTITIAKRPVRVTATDLAMVFGDPTPQLDYQVDPGLLNDDVLVGSLKLADSLRVGANEVVEDEPFANPNYQVTFVPGTLTVTANPAQQEVIDSIDQISLPIVNWDDADQVAVATLAYDALDEANRTALPSTTVETLGTAQTQASVVNHRNTENGVTASSTDLPWSVRLVAAPNGSTSPEYADVSAKLSAGQSLIGLYDIYFVHTLTGERWQPAVGSPVHIELSKVSLDGYHDIGVTHRLHDGTVERVPSTLNGNIISFDGSSFSLYGVSGVSNSAHSLPRTGSENVPGLTFAAALLLLTAGALVLVPRTRK